MGNVTNITQVKFSVGALVHHRLFDYRGVIVDVDQNFQATDEWYEAVAKSRPPKSKPWYHVLVHGSDHSTYVAEQNLEADDVLEPINHPMVEHFFSRFDHGRYVRIDSDNQPGNSYQANAVGRGQGRDADLSVMAQSDDNWFEREQLHFAAAEGDLKKVIELIEKGYDVNAFDADLSLTPLHYAVRGEFLKISQYLLDNGADINAHDEDKIGETPLGDVAATCSHEMAELLVDAGANPTIPGWMQITALHRAKDRKNEEGKKVYELLAKTAKEKFNFAP